MKTTPFKNQNTLKLPGLARVQYFRSSHSGLSQNWQVSIDDIHARNWNLDFKNPKGGEVEEEMSSKELVERILGFEGEIRDIIVSL